MRFDIIGYVKIERIKPPILYNFHHLYNIGFGDFFEYEKCYEEYNDYIIFDLVKQVFINNAGEMQINSAEYYLIIGKDCRTVYALYHNMMVKIGKITEWRKTPFSNKSFIEHENEFLSIKHYI